MLRGMSEGDASRLDAKVAPDAALEEARAGGAVLLLRLAILVLRVAAALLIATPLALLGWALLR